MFPPIFESCIVCKTSWYASTLPSFFPCLGFKIMLGKPHFQFCINQFLHQYQHTYINVHSKQKKTYKHSSSQALHIHTKAIWNSSVHTFMNNNIWTNKLTAKHNSACINYPSVQPCILFIPNKSENNERYQKTQKEDPVKKSHNKLTNNKLTK